MPPLSVTRSSGKSAARSYTNSGRKRGTARLARGESPERIAERACTTTCETAPVRVTSSTKSRSSSYESSGNEPSAC
eukprot:6278703-Prymnesium_polylepis.2